MEIKFNPSGTQVVNSRLIVRLDLYPGTSDKTYALHYVKVPDVPPDFRWPAWDKPLPAFPLKWQLNPCLSHFVAVPETVSVSQLGEWITRTFNRDMVGAIDDILVKPDPLHWIDPLMRRRWLTQETVKTKDYADLVQSTRTKLASLPVISLSGGGSVSINPETINMGAGATDRSTTGAALYSVLQLGNAANASGTITSYGIWFNTNATGVKAGVAFLVSGTTYQCRSSYNWGNVASSSKQTASGLSLDVVTGDLCHFYCTTGTLERDTSGGTGQRYVSGEYLDPGDQASYTGSSAGDVSLEAAGTESGGGIAIPVAIYHQRYHNKAV